jgi:carbon starvation protein
MEGVVGVVALVAASALFPGDYFAINTLQKTPEQSAKYERMVEEHSSAGFDLRPQEIDRLQEESGEKNLRGRTGGAVTLALGIAKIFDAVPGLSGLMKYWYHFAIMFEALFILTTIDTGTRVGRFLVGEFLGRWKKEFARPDWQPGATLTTLLIVLGWGALIWKGSISTIWPMFGVANQLLASVALCVATTILLNSGKARYAWTTLVPLAFVGSTTLVAGFFSITDNFLVMARKADTAAQGWINAALTAMLMVAAVIIVVDSTRKWLRPRGGDVARAPARSPAS